MINGIHPATSRSWGSDAGARLLQIVMESNNGMAQQVIENKTDQLDLYSLEEIIEPDDLGLTLPFLAVFYDQPDILEYLARRGVDLRSTCDSVGFGTPMFYAVTLQKTRIISVLDKLKCSVNSSCDRFNQTPLFHAERLGNPHVSEVVNVCSQRENKAKDMFYKNFIKSRARKNFLKMKSACIIIQRFIRVQFARSNAEDDEDISDFKT